MPDGGARRRLSRLRAAWWGMPLVYAVLLAAPSATLPGDDLGIRRFRTPPVAPELRLAQTFMAPVDGVHAVDLYPVAGGNAVTGTVRLDVYELNPDSAAVVVRTATVSAADIAAAPTYRFEFEPILDSKDRTYRLEVVSLNGQGPAFWATRGERYDSGVMYANGRERWADLAFQVHAPMPSVWGRLMMLRETNPARAYVFLAALVAVWLLVGLVLREMEALPA